MTQMNLPNYHNRHTTDSTDEQLLFLPNRGLQAPELNEMQSIRERHIQRIADQFMVDGSVQKGGEVVIDQQSGHTLCAKSEIYLRGRIRDVAKAEFTIPIVGEVQVGVWLEDAVITELEDPTLRDPCEGSRNYDERGAARLRVTAEWGLSTDNRNGNFYRVYDVENGVIKLKSAPPDMTGFNNALARYDRDNNGGHYVIRGLEVIYIDHDADHANFSILEGKAHVYGHEIELPTALRRVFDYDPDLQTVLSEPHQYTDDGTGGMQVHIDRKPINNIIKVDITKQVTETIVHGSFAGVADPLPNTSVIEIISVTQNQTTYTAGTDFTFVAGSIDWSPSGNEPAPGSSYEVTYKHITQATPINADEYGFRVEGAVDGSLVMVDYQWRLPRIDTVTIDRDGVITRIKGLPRHTQAKAVPAPIGQLELAHLYWNWFDDNPVTVVNTAITAVSMATLQDMRADIFDLYDLVAIERLKSDAIASAPAATRGVFVDPFLNDVMRDLGIAQTAAIVDGILTLPINPSIHALDATATAITLPYDDEVIIEQTARTGIMKINPYAAFDPIPANCELMPPVDNWTEKQTINLAEQTRVFGGGLQARISFMVQRQTKAPKKAEFLRPITIKFKIVGFKEDEPLRSVVFDGVQIPVEAQA